MKKNIILIGYMGSGKSAVGQKIAGLKAMNFIDLDAYIEEKEQQSIKNIFKEKGEIYFRKIETKYLKEVLSEQFGTVLALGGGTPCFGNNINLVNSLENGISIYLQTSIKELNERLLLITTKRILLSKQMEDLSLKFLS